MVVGHWQPLRNTVRTEGRCRNSSGARRPNQIRTSTGTYDHLVEVVEGAIARKAHDELAPCGEMVSTAAICPRAAGISPSKPSTPASSMVSVAARP